MTTVGDGKGVSRNPPAGDERLPPQLRRLIWVFILLFAGLVMFVIILATWPSRPSRTVSGPHVTPLTALPGEEVHPSLSPDGSLVAYAHFDGEDWDIHVLELESGEWINLTENSAEAEVHPSFAPDGARIAFRSTQAGGGLFVMDRAGGSVQQITSFGFHPSWSPDGRKIAFSSGEAVDPAMCRQQPSELWVVDLETGEEDRLHAGDAVQPNWSPDGKEIAFWGVHHSQADVWITPMGEGVPIRVTADSHSDWGASWWGRRRELIFVSDRRGFNEPWLVNVAEESPPFASRPFLKGVPAVGAATTTTDGSRIVFPALSTTWRLERMVFSPDTEAVGKETSLGVPAGLSHCVVSPNGEWAACTSSAPNEGITIV
jgi:Tol biopolymer transport system component